MSVDNTALFKIGYGLYVVTSFDGNRHNGLIVNTVTQVTNTPNRIAVTINKESYSSQHNSLYTFFFLFHLFYIRLYSFADLFYHSCASLVFTSFLLQTFFILNGIIPHFFNPII